MSSSLPKPHQKPIEDLEIFELMALVIERGEAARFARLYGCSVQTVRKWRNDPEADDNTEGDPHGRTSPVENFLQFMDALNAISPARADTTWKRVEHDFAEMQRIQGNDTRARRLRALLRANQLAREIVTETDPYGATDDG